MNSLYPIFEHSAFSGLIGAAECDMTPPVGIYSRNWGAALTDTASGIHQPLILCCITFQTAVNERPLVLVSLDLCMWRNKEDEQFVRHEILNALGLDAANLMICLSHTHSSPSISREDAFKPGGGYIEPYLIELREKAIATIQKALSNAAPSVLTWQYGTCNLATNRDLPEIGKDRIVVGYNADKSADNTLLVGRITNKNNTITATIVNYACHPTTLAWDNHLISPDYVGSLRNLVQDETNAPCLFMQGASGELAPAEQYSGDTALAERHGREVGFAVLSTLQSMLAPGKVLSFDAVVESGAALAVWKQTPANISSKLSAKLIDIPLPLKELQPLAEIEAQWDACEDHVLKERLWRKLQVRKKAGDTGSTVPLWAWQIGDSFFLGQPNEAYSLFQTELRRHFPHNAIAVMNVVNGHVGYLPYKELYDENIYSVWQTPFAQGALEKLISSATETIELMYTKK